MTILDFPKFQLNEEPTSLSQEWIKWTTRLENLFVALDINTDKWQNALLLHYAGTQASDIYYTLGDTEETYDAAKNKLSVYF